MHYGPMLLSSFVLVAPVAALVGWVFVDHILWVMLLIWWSKPVWERAHLFVLSQALFGPRPTVRETLRAFPNLARRDLLACLSYRRFSPSRSFDLPVTQLEGSTGADRARRLGVLHRGRFTGASILLTSLLFHVESALMFAFIVLLELLIPDLADLSLVEWALGFDGDRSVGARLFNLAVAIGAWLLVAPFYIGAGFSLYLHRRTILEAWDLELAFRRLAERAKRRGGGAGAGAAAPLLAAAVLTLASPFDAAPAWAEEGLTPEAASTSIEAILAGDEFHQIEVVTLPRFLLDWELERDEERDPSRWLERLMDSLAGGFEAILVALAIGFLFWLGLRIMASRSGWQDAPASRTTRRRGRAPVELFGLEVTEESLPEDVVRSARGLAADGDLRGALALLYRAALAKLAARDGAAFSPGVTEGECIVIARPLLPDDGARYFERLTGTWIRCAYGRLAPDLERLDELCLDWRRWFEGAGQPEREGGDAG